MNELPMELVEMKIRGYPLEQKVIFKTIAEEDDYTEYTISWRLYHKGKQDV